METENTWTSGESLRVLGTCRCVGATSSFYEGGWHLCGVCHKQIDGVNAFGNNAALDRLAQANAHRPKLWMCPDCHVRCRVENAPNHADTCHALQQAAKCDESLKPEAAPMRNTENPSGVQAPGSRGSSLKLVEHLLDNGDFNGLIAFVRQLLDLNESAKCRCGHTRDEHFSGRGMSKEELHPCNFDSCSCLKFDAWVQDPNVMTHAVCRHGVTYGERCPDCEATQLLSEQDFIAGFNAGWSSRDVCFSASTHELEGRVATSERDYALSAFRAYNGPVVEEKTSAFTHCRQCGHIQIEP